MTLLDTHALLWYLRGDQRLSQRAKETIESREACLVSKASLWEIAIKISAVKLAVELGTDELVRIGFPVNGLTLLTIRAAHMTRVEKLPIPANGHRDPFDRLLVAQALTDGFALVSADEKLDAYGIERI